MPTRLIFPFVALFGRLDVETTAEPVDEFDSGFDPVFREPRRLTDGTQAGASARVEIETRILCQVETEQQGQLSPAAGGDSPISEFTIVMLMRDLDELGLVSASGDALLKKQDRLIQIETTEGAVHQSFPDPPGLYIHEVRTDSYGMSLISPRAQLCIVVLRARETSVR
jgi:hypothetical protein